MPSPVYLVGAGSGDPGLLTLRAAELLGQADLVIYDQLVPRRLLDFAREGAEVVCVREISGKHPEKYPQILTMMIDAANAGKTVVRLKGGDPLVFGRGGEESEALREAGIDYEIVPGVTAALAAAAYLEIPISHRKFPGAIALVTGHESPNKPGNLIDWDAMARFPGTLAIYMGIARLPLILSELITRGKDADTPSTIVERASSGAMRSVQAPLHDLDRARRAAGLEAPGLILIGANVALRPDRSWFERRPLFGHHILITRPRHQSGDFLRKLEQLGAVPYQLPTMEIADVVNFTPVDETIHELAEGKWDWLVFTSSNGVRKLMERLFHLGRDLRSLGRVKIAVVGPRTAKALRDFHLRADLVPREFHAEGLLQELKPLVAGQRVLLARADRGREILREGLREVVAAWKEVEVYRQVDAVAVDEEILNALRRGEIGVVTLTSANIARAFLSHCDETIRDRIARKEIQLVTGSSETARVCEPLPAIIARNPTDEAMIEALRTL